MQKVRHVTLYELNKNRWQSEILSYSCECLTQPMKVFCLKWPEIMASLTRQGKTDSEGYTLVNYAYIAACIGTSYRTALRIVTDMHNAGYLEKKSEPIEGFILEMKVKVLAPVWNCQFHALPKTNKGKGQRKYCHKCGSKNVRHVRIDEYTCLDCGNVERIVKIER